MLKEKKKLNPKLGYLIQACIFSKRTSIHNTQTHSQASWKGKSIFSSNFHEQVAVSNFILHNNIPNMDTCLVVFCSICTASPMSKDMAQIMKPTKLRMKRLLSVFWLWYELFKLIIVTNLYADSFTWHFAISTVLYWILSARYFEVEWCLISYMNININISTMEHGNIWCGSWFRSINRHNVLVL